ncbi:hypothetical protein [Paraburkholderia youngii]|uniref:hypothetical protein n=1 Tax=Paraburkholderia youngii TaxID=2782701 RepID=UPI003D1CF552
MSYLTHGRKAASAPHVMSQRNAARAKSVHPSSIIPSRAQNLINAGSSYTHFGVLDKKFLTPEKVRKFISQCSVALKDPLQSSGRIISLYTFSLLI